MPGVKALVVALAAVVVVVVVSAGCAPCQAPLDLPADSAQDFRDSVGTSAYLHFENTPAARCPETRFALAYVGIRHLRSGPYAANGPAATCQRQLAAEQGTRFLFGSTTGCITDGTAKVDEAVALWQASGLTGSTDALEGPNEPNWKHSHCEVPEDWAARTRALMAHLHSRVGESVPIVAPSLAVYRDEHAELGDLTGYGVDFGNLHAYPGAYPFDLYGCEKDEFNYDKCPGGDPATRPYDPSLDFEHGFQEFVVGHRRSMITEMGWAVGADHTAQEQGVYALRAALAGFAKKDEIARTYLFTLVDHEAGFGYGLFDSNWQARPAAHYLHRLMTLVGGFEPRAEPRPLRFGWRYAPPDAPMVVLKAPGYHAVVAWRAAPLDAPAVRVEAYTDGPAPSMVRFYDPTVSTTATREWTRPSSVAFHLGPQPIVLRVWP
jgi:hypothetical protein